MSRKDRDARAWSSVLDTPFRDELDRIDRYSVDSAQVTPLGPTGWIIRGLLANGLAGGGGGGGGAAAARAGGGGGGGGRGAGGGGRRAPAAPPAARRAPGRRRGRARRRHHRSRGR
ncbi:hypothetical protein, partial [Nocardia cyriacigeorgica]|uniref:hypothetical protein n=1 Tax=Nocardia cyriacigeorgica TaxID=135487 RepID=UPI002457D611